jgi:hypothetical protein
MSSSVGIQMPQLYLRGSLCSKTMKGLKSNNVEKIEEIVCKIMDDDLLQPCRNSFKNALRTTIGGDYRDDQDTAEQEYKVAIWRAAVAMMFGWGKNSPCPQIMDDKIQRKKFFQTWIFRYLKQILNENKRPILKSKKTEILSPYEISKNKIIETINDDIKIMQDYDGNCNITTNKSIDITKLSSIIEEYSEKGVSFKISENVICISSHFSEISQKIKKIIPNISSTRTEWLFETKVDLNLCSSDTINALHEEMNKYFNSRIEISITDKSIRIIDDLPSYENSDIKVLSRVSMSSTCSNDNDEIKPLEIEDMHTEHFQDPETLSCFVESLSPIAKEVVKIMIDPPDMYIKKYNTTKAVQKYVADYLKLSAKDTKKIYGELRLKYINMVGTID